MPSTAETALPSFSARFLGPYRRITSSGQFIPEIDGLRFIAIFSVFIYHLAGDVLRHTTAGHQPSLDSNFLFAATQVLNIGVPLFFVISGFILSTPFASVFLHHQRPVSLKKYFLRRIARLEPPYIISLLLFFALKTLTARGTAGELFPHLMASLFYLHNLIFGTPSVINFVAWSLEIEIQFYILVPAIALVFAIRSGLTRRLIMIASILAATGISRLVVSHSTLENSLLAYAQYFLTGILFAEFYLSSGDQRHQSWLWDLASVAGWSALLILLVRGGAAVVWTIPWLIFLLYVAAFRSVFVNRLVTNLWIATIGGMCYTIYLLHNYVVAGLGTFTERFFLDYSFTTRLSIQFLMITPVLLVISGLYFRLIERPCMRPYWPRELLIRIASLRSRWMFAPAAAAAEAEAAQKD
jgi:peptidoglycan/LPS O-acetylase OafA/YrhL